MNKFNRDTVESLCEVVYVLNKKGFTDDIIYKISPEFEFSVSEALNFYEYVYNTLTDFNLSFLDNLNKLSLEEIEYLAKEWILTFNR